jgi:hypothetical protein
MQQPTHTHRVLISVHNKTIQINYSRRAKERAELNIHGESIVKVAPLPTFMYKCVCSLSHIWYTRWPCLVPPELLCYMLFQTFCYVQKTGTLCGCACWFAPLLPLFMHYLNMRGQFSNDSNVRLCISLWLMLTLPPNLAAISLFHSRIAHFAPVLSRW